MFSVVFVVNLILFFVISYKVWHIRKGVLLEDSPRDGVKIYGGKSIKTSMEAPVLDHPIFAV